VIRFLLQSLRLLLISALAGAAWVAHRPAELPAAAQPTKGKADDILDLMRQSAIKRASLMTISEEEVNRHLSTILAGRMRGTAGEWVEFDGVRVKLEQDSARLFLVWKIQGQARTASVDLAINRDDEQFHVEILKGAYGHLEVPRGLMRPLYPALRSIAEALDPEIRALFQMTRITFAKDKLVLDPRFPPA